MTTSTDTRADGPSATDPTDVASIPTLDTDEAMRLQAAELERDLALLRSLSPDEWQQPTVCDGWDVRDVWLHVLGACEAGASIPENVRQLRSARRRRRKTGEPLEACLSALQIERRSDVTPDELVQRLAEVAPRTVRGRSKVPGFVRRREIEIDGPVIENWTLGYLTDVIYLRDLWLHRIDTADAVGMEPVLTAEHDGRIIADVVAEWARRHGQPFDLELTGPAGGRFVGGSDADTAAAPIRIDAIDFAKSLSGRIEADGLLATVVPF